MSDTNEIRKAIMDRLGSVARPGAKAEMGKRYDAKIIGDELVRSDGRRYQITGRKPSLPNAREMQGELEWLFIVGNNGAQYSVQRFDDGGYRVFGGSSGMSVQWDGLLRASRPGAKAAMARDVKVQRGTSRDAVAVVGRNGGGDGGYYAGLILRHKDGEEQVLWMKHGYSTEKAAERAAVQRIDSHVSRMSRPGAKAKSTHAAVDVRTELMLRSWIRNNFPNAGNAEFNKIFAKMLKQYAKDPQGYTYGGGFRAVAKAAGFSKSTHAHSEAVSKKIALLMKEGKPQAQAVAIALDMERRGEL